MNDFCSENYKNLLNKFRYGMYINEYLTFTKIFI